MTHIALFGTSADPPTIAHQMIISKLSQQFDWVAVWAANNPMKSHQKTPLEHRSAMLQLLVADVGVVRNNIGVYPELSSSRTIETLEKAKQWWLDAVFTLVIGSDLMGQIHKWYRSQELLQEVDLFVVMRPGYPIHETDLLRLRQLGTSVAIADFQAPAGSSSAYRQHGKTIEPIYQLPILTPAIEDYIHRQQLYVCQDAT